MNRPRGGTSLAPFLVLAFAAALLAGCGESGGDTTAATETAAAQSEGTTTAPDEVAAELKALELEKETAEAEAEQARFAAQRETKEAERAAARQAKRQAVKAQQKRAARAAARAEAEDEQEAEAEESSAPPNVVGLPLPAAKSALRSAGFTTAAVNTDTLFGIVNEDNYTICRQDPPRGTVIKVLAQKYGC